MSKGAIYRRWRREAEQQKEQGERSMQELVKRLRELEAAATPAPWEIRTPENYDDMGDATYKVFPPGKCESFDGLISDEPYYNTAPSKVDVELLVEMRNSILPLLDRLEKLEVVAEAAEKVTSYETDRSPLRDALAALAKG